MKPKVGVVLSGCGVYDGAEIHESVLTLLALDRAGAEAVCLAPDAAQRHVVNHLTGQPVEGESRNVLIEAARIARGRVKDLDFDFTRKPVTFNIPVECVPNCVFLQKIEDGVWMLNINTKAK